MIGSRPNNWHLATLPMRCLTLTCCWCWDERRRHAVCWMLPSGAAFEGEYILRVTAEDVAYASAHGGQSNRTLWLHASDAHTGEEVVSTVTMAFDCH